jgi:hypothetical protein
MKTCPFVITVTITTATATTAAATAIAAIMTGSTLIYALPTFRYLFPFPFVPNPPLIRMSICLRSYGGTSTDMRKITRVFFVLITTTTTIATIATTITTTISTIVIHGTVCGEARWAIHFKQLQLQARRCPRSSVSDAVPFSFSNSVTPAAAVDMATVTIASTIVTSQLLRQNLERVERPGV